jgi:lysophospholipase L1-like esterase
MDIKPSLLSILSYQHMNILEIIPPSFKNFLLSLLIAVIALSVTSAQQNVTFFGSSVCKGASADSLHGYAWQLFHSGAIDTSEYIYFNASTGGDNTLKIEEEGRLDKMLFPTEPDYVVIGLSLGNEGIRSPQDNNGREQLQEQFRSRLLALADSLHRINIEPIIVNCYAHSYFTQDHYNFTKKMNRIINTWDYPSVNVLGTIDDFTGKWVEGYVGDPWHPNTKGHQEMSYAFVPSLFEAIKKGKKPPSYDWSKSFTQLKNDDNVENPLYFNVDNTIHSFTLSFRFKNSNNGSIAGFISENTNHKIGVEEHTITYKSLSRIFPKHLKDWTHIVLSHSYANQLTILYINGKPIGKVKEQLTPTKIYFGGSASIIDLKDLTLHRSCLNEDEALDLFNKKFIQSSLEFYNSMTCPVINQDLENKAQSLSRFSIDKRIILDNKLIQLY